MSVYPVVDPVRRTRMETEVTMNTLDGGSSGGSLTSLRGQRSDLYGKLSIILLKNLIKSLRVLQ